MRMKKLIAALLACAMVLGLTACGKEKEEPKPEFVYVPEYISLPSEENSNNNVMQITGDTLYYSQWSFDETTGFGAQKYFKIDLTDSAATPQELTLGLGEGINSMRMCFDADGNVYTANQTYETTEVTDAEGNTHTEYNYENAVYTLEKYAADGSLIWQADITEYMQGEYSYMQYMTLDKDGNVYMTNGESNIWVYDNQGQKLFNLEVSSWVQGMGTSKDGEVYITTGGSNGTVVKKVDVATKSFGPELAGFPDNFYEGVMPGIEKDFLIKTGSSLFEYDMETQTCELILKFLDCDMNSDYVQMVSVLSDGRIGVYYRDWSTNESEVIALTKTPYADVPEKEIITMGTMYLPQNIQAAIVKFNKSNDQYRITVKDYSESLHMSGNMYAAGNAGEDPWGEAMTRMNNDILTGNAPDMICLGNVNMQLMAAKGVFEDLAPYLENSQVLKRDELVESVLQAYTMNDTLCGIPTTFNIVTMMAPTSKVGEEMGWTLDEMMELVEKMPEDAQIMEYATKNSILGMMLRCSADSYVNWETGECHFDSDDFIKVLEFANKFPMEFEYSEDNPSLPELARSGSLLVTDQYIGRTGEFQIMPKVWGEPMTCIGYPTSSGTGSAISGDGAIAISAKSKHKEAAWSFIEEFVKNSAEDDMYSWGFSTVKSKLEATFEEDMTPSYQYDMDGEIMKDENGNPIENSKGGWSFGNSNETFDIYAATQEEVDQIKELINNSTTVMTMDEQLLAIIQEEAAPYFDGQKSAQEAAEIIQNRIQVYVDESR